MTFIPFSNLILFRHHKSSEEMMKILSYSLSEVGKFGEELPVPGLSKR
jgi:hypothetical protein